jgi:hypothetical protein
MSIFVASASIRLFCSDNLKAVHIVPFDTYAMDGYTW